MQKGGVLSAESAPLLVTLIENLGRNTAARIREKLVHMNLVDDTFVSKLTKYKLDGDVLNFHVIGPVIKGAALAFMDKQFDEKNLGDYLEIYSAYNAQGEPYGFDDYVRELLDAARTEECNAKLAALSEAVAADDVAGHADFIAKCAWRPYIMYGLLVQLKQAVKNRLVELYGEAEKDDGTKIKNVENLALEIGYAHHLENAFKKGLTGALEGIEAVVDGGARLLKATSGLSKIGTRRPKATKSQQKSKGRRHTRKNTRKNTRK